MASKEDPLFQRINAPAPAGELSQGLPPLTVRQRNMISLLSMPMVDMRQAITSLSREDAEVAHHLECRGLRRRWVLALLQQQRLLQLIGDQEVANTAMFISRDKFNSIVNALLLARVHTRAPLHDLHLAALRRDLDAALDGLEAAHA